MEKLYEDFEECRAYEGCEAYEAVMKVFKDVRLEERLGKLDGLLELLEKKLKEEAESKEEPYEPTFKVGVDIGGLEPHEDVIAKIFGNSN